MNDMGMGKRKWISASMTKGMCWWDCPGPHCEHVRWNNGIPVNSTEKCKLCNIKYTILQAQQNRVLIEVK